MKMSMRGSILVQVLIVSALLTVVGLTSAITLYNTVSQNQVAASRAATIPLAGALRTQLSKNASCVASFSPAPSTYTADSEVSVNVGATHVQAGADLDGYGLHVTSLALTGLNRFATTNTGNAIYLAELVLRTESSQLSSGTRVSFRPVTVARMTFEVQGANTLVSCHATDPSANLADQLQQICRAVASIDGLSGGWSPGTGCVVYDASADVRCVRLGGTWMGGWCSFAPPTFVVTRVVGPGAPGETWYGVNCPAGTSLMGGTCATTSGPNPPLGTAYFGNGAYCSWGSGFETSQFTLYATCAP